MQSLATFIRPVSLIEADAPVGEAEKAFEANPAACALVVMRDGGVVGVLHREAASLCDNRLHPVQDAMVASAISADVSTSPKAAAALLASHPDRTGDMLVVCADRRPIGLCTLGALIEGLREGDEPRLEQLADEMHDPLDTLFAMTDLLQRQPLSSDMAAQVLTIREAGETMRRLLKSAEDIALAHEGPLELNPEPLQLRRLLDEIQAGWERRSRQSGVTLLLSYDGDPDLTAVVDGSRLRQIFDSLIIPAIYYSPAGCVEVSLKASLHHGFVHIEGSVRDSNGAAPERLAEALEAGRVSEGADWVNVAVARRLVEALNGTIRAESNRGVGVTVTFALACEAVCEQGTDRGGSRLPSKRAHILIVDDNATNRMVVEALLEMFDCTSECAEDGVRAIEIARTGRFDLILMDIKMPRMGGLEACRAIRALSGPAASTPILALTANVDPEDARSYVAAGMCGVVEKPIKAEQLLQAINAALQSAAGPRRSAA